MIFMLTITSVSNNTNTLTTINSQTFNGCANAESFMQHSIQANKLRKVCESEHQQYGNENRNNAFYKIALPSIILFRLYEKTI